jgi:phosphotransacetylase
LSYATCDSNSGDVIDKVIKAIAFAKKIAQEVGLMYPNLIEGPLQFDAAVDPAIAAAAAAARHSIV